MNYKTSDLWELPSAPSFSAQCISVMSLIPAVLCLHVWGVLTWVLCSFFTDRPCNDGLWMSPAGLQGLGTPDSSHMASPLACLPLICLFAALPLQMDMYTCMIVSLLCHFLGRFGKAHGAGGRTWRPWPRGSSCHSRRRQSWRRGEIWGVRLQRSAQWSHLPGQEHPRLQT